MFTGRNIIPGLPETLVRVIDFLNGKANDGEFEFSDSLEKWADQEDVIEPLGLRYENDKYYYAVSTAYIACKGNGHIKVTEDVHIWSWVLSLYVLAEYAGWEPDFMQRVIMSFVDKESDIDDILDNVAQTYAKFNFECGMKLIENMDRFKTSILSGLMENNFLRYCELFPPEKHQDDFTEAYIRTADLNKDEHERVFDITMTFSTFTSPASMALLLKVHHMLYGGKKDECEKKVLDLLEKEDVKDYVNVVCPWIIREKERTDFVENVVLSLIDKLGKENNNLLGVIDHAIAVRHNDPDFLVRIIIKVAEAMSPENVLKMVHCLRRLEDNHEKFVNIVFLFIVHTQGEYRRIGRLLWDQNHLETTDLNLANFDEAVQCAFAYFMLQDHGNPDMRLPKVLPLLKTRNKKVKAFLMRILQPYTDNYMGHVSTALDKLKINNKESKLIKDYVNQRWAIIQKRRELKELAPEYTYGKEYREAKRVEREFLKSRIKEAEDSHDYMWMEFAHKVVLARGEGWRMPDGTTQKLSKIQFSAPAPMMNESLSPMEMRKWVEDIMTDWNDTTGNH